MGEGDGTPLQYSCLKNPMDGGAWWAAVHGVAKSRTRLHFHFHFSLSCIGEGNGNPLQCSCLENPRDGGAWWATVYGVAQSRTRLKRLTLEAAQGAPREPRRDSRGERSPWLPLETRPDSPGAEVSSPFCRQKATQTWARLGVLQGAAWPIG